MLASSLNTYQSTDALINIHSEAERPTQTTSLIPELILCVDVKPTISSPYLSI